MSKRSTHSGHAVTHCPITRNAVVFPGSAGPGNVKIEPAVNGLCAVTTNIKAQKSGNETIGPFEIVDLYIGDGLGGAQWLARRERNLSDENDTGVAYHFTLGPDTYFVLAGQVMKVAAPKFEVIPQNSRIAWQVRGENHSHREQWKSAQQVKIVG